MKNLIFSTALFLTVFSGLYGQNVPTYYNAGDPNGVIISKERLKIVYDTINKVMYNADCDECTVWTPIGGVDGNGIYGGSSSLIDTTVVELGGFDLTFGVDETAGILTVSESQSKVSINANPSQLELGGNTELDVWGNIGAGDVGFGTLVVGHDSFDPYVGGTFKYNATLYGVGSGSNATDIQQSTVVGADCLVNTVTITGSNVIGHKAGLNARYMYDCNIMGNEAYYGSGSPTFDDIISIGDDNGKWVSDNINGRVMIGSGYKYHTGNNSLILGSYMMTDESDPLTSIDDVFMLGMNSNILMQSIIGEGYVQINDILRLPDASTLPVGYTETVGDLRWNGTASTHQGFDGNAWIDYNGGGGSSTVEQYSLTSGTTTMEVWASGLGITIVENQAAGELTISIPVNVSIYSAQIVLSSSALDVNNDYYVLLDYVGSRGFNSAVGNLRLPNVDLGSGVTVAMSRTSPILYSTDGYANVDVGISSFGGGDGSDLEIAIKDFLISSVQQVHLKF